MVEKRNSLVQKKDLSNLSELLTYVINPGFDSRDKFISKLNLQFPNNKN